MTEYCVIYEMEDKKIKCLHPERSHCRACSIADSKYGVSPLNIDGDDNEDGLEKGQLTLDQVVHL